MTIEMNPGIRKAIARNPQLWGNYFSGLIDPEVHLNEGLPIPSKGKQLVVSHFKEDLSWLSDVVSDWSILVYTKGGSLSSLPEGIPVRRLENVGREGHTIVNHIVTRWNELADWTVFAQGDATSRHCPDFCERLQDFPQDRPVSYLEHYSSDFPSKVVKATDQIQEIAGHVVRLGDARSFGDFQRPQTTAWLDALWSYWFKNDRPETWFFAYANHVGASREDLRNRPLDFWCKWLDEIQMVGHDHNYTYEFPRLSSAWSLELLMLAILDRSNAVRWDSPTNLDVIRVPFVEQITPKEKAPCKCGDNAKLKRLLNR